MRIGRITKSSIVFILILLPILIGFLNCSRPVSSKKKNIVNQNSNDVFLLGTHSVIEYGSPLSIEDHVAKLQSLNIKVSRNGLNWNLIQPTSSSSLNFTELDQIVNSLNQAGIVPLIVIVNSPCWANYAPTTGQECSSYVPWNNETQFNDWLTKFKNFVRASAQHFKGRVKHWELWNEPNHLEKWGPLDLNKYFVWSREINNILIEIDPSVKVAFGGGVMALDQAFQSQIKGTDFIEALYQFGLRPKVISIHVYPLKNEAPDVVIEGVTTFRDVEKIRQIQLKYTPPDSEIWITEFGWYTDGWVWGFPTTHQKQAEYLARALEIINTEWPYLKIATWFLDINRWGKFESWSVQLYNEETNTFSDKPLTHVFRTGQAPPSVD